MTDSKKTIEPTVATAHRQARGLRTRQALILSAREIFASDGFEHARIEDIALKAGKTRGAFYANFKDKEDVFCAIFEEDIDRELATLNPLLAQAQSREQIVEFLCGYLSELGKDRQRTLLNLEFKLYAIRHPRKRKRLANLHALMRLRCSIPEFKVLSQGSGQPYICEPPAGCLAIGGVLDGLALNHLFDPGALDDAEFAKYLKLCVREALYFETSTHPATELVPALPVS